MDANAANAVLKSSGGHFAQVIISFGLALATSFGRLIYLQELDPATGDKASTGIADSKCPNAERRFVLVALTFLTSQAFTVAKTLRDNQAAEMKIPGGALGANTSAWTFQVFLVAALALWATIDGFLKMDLPVEEKGFLALATLFLVSSTLNLAKTIRDRSDAAELERMAGDQTQHVLQLAKGTNGNAAQVIIFMLCAVAGTCHGLHQLGLSFETESFLFMGLSFMIVSAFFLAKTVRDNGTANKQPNMQNWLLVVGAMGLSAGLTITGITRHEMPLQKKMFLGLGMICCVSGAFNVAKLSRDREEVEEIIKRAGNGGGGGGSM